MIKIITPIVFLYLFLCTNFLYSQIKNKYDFHVKYQINNITSNLDQTYIDNRYGTELPTVLGNLKNNYSYEIGLLNSNYSYFFQPGVIYSQMKYSGNGSLQNPLNDYHITSYALGLQCKFNLFAYGKHTINPYLQVYASYMYSVFESARNNFIMSIPSNNSDAYYSIMLDYKNDKETFFNPLFGISMGSEILLNNRMFIISEIGAMLKNYPEFDIPSPDFLSELTFSIGIRYKILRDKHFIYKN